MNKVRLNLTLRLLFVSTLLLILTGCWSANEPKDLAIINVIGVDVNDDGNIELTANVVKPENIFPQTSTDSEVKQQQVLLETAEGKNIFQAFGKLSSSIPKRIFLGHVNVVIFGEKLARERMVSSLDFFKRQNDFRPNILLFVTKGEAKSILKATPELNKTLGLEIKRLTDTNRFSSTKTVKDLSKFLEDLSSNTVDPVTSGISYAENQGIEVGVQDDKGAEKEDTPAVKTSNNTSSVLRLNETAVFKGGNLIGWLNETETRGLLWVKGELENDIIVLNCGDKGKGTIGLNITKTESQLSPKVKNGKAMMDITVHVEADIAHVTCPNLNINASKLADLNQQLEDTISEEIADVLLKAQKRWQTDIFGFGEQVYRKYPSKWDQMAKGWRNGGLRDMKVNTEISANITRFGLLKNPIKANESR